MNRKILIFGYIFVLRAEGGRDIALFYCKELYKGVIIYMLNGRGKNEKVIYGTNKE